MDLIEWMFNAIKRNECNLQKKGQWESLLSLCESTEKQKGKKWINVLKKLGYCQ